MRIRNMAAAGLLCALPTQALAQPATQPAIPGEDCGLCRALGADARTDLVSGGAEAYERNLDALSNCLDLRILGPDQQFTARERWQDNVSRQIGDGVWIHASSQNAPEKCGPESKPCLESHAKISDLYLVLFGKVGFDAREFSADEKARLSCQAIFADLKAATSEVEAAAQ